jgi:beta-N-acetylhexosaminidase
LGLILFSRNIQSPEQLLRLTEHFKDVTENGHALVLIDQEGGRVSRLPAAYWRVPPSPTVFAEFYEIDKAAAIHACRINSELIGWDLKQCGINVNCGPMMDIPQSDSSSIVKDRALGWSAEQVIALSQATIQGLKKAGVEPVIKHGPGHGRATKDSHKDLPVVSATPFELASKDYLPFMRFNDQSMLMTAHVLYEQVDEVNPATVSPKIINNVIREEIGFGGLIMTDDIDMHALTGSPGEIAQRALAAGCDVILQCNGRLEDLMSLEPSLSFLEGASLERAQLCMAAANRDVSATDKYALEFELKMLFDDFGLSQ